MTKQEMLKILRLLSALESASLVSKIALPDYLYEQLTDATEVLEREILKLLKTTSSSWRRRLGSTGLRYTQQRLKKDLNALPILLPLPSVRNARRCVMNIWNGRRLAQKTAPPLSEQGGIHEADRRTNLEMQQHYLL